MGEQTETHEAGRCPMHSLAASDLTYQDYLKVPSLLGLQKVLSSPPHHDEMLFIIIHQAYELWFKLILHEMETAIVFMGHGNILRAHHFLNRIVQIMKLLVQQIHILETMTPVEFLEFRENLMPASGFQSIQFREIEFLAGLKDDRYLEFFQNRPDFFELLKSRFHGPDLRDSYYTMLVQMDFEIPELASKKEYDLNPEFHQRVIRGLLPIYQSPSDYLPLYLLSESLVELDEYLGLWREHHVRVVERVIGMKPGTGGSDGVGYLKSTTGKKCFPRLWEVRTYLKKNQMHSMEIPSKR
jgi:tryptophan 2,3-dioxygenase